MSEVTVLGKITLPARTVVMVAGIPSYLIADTEVETNAMNIRLMMESINDGKESTGHSAGIHANGESIDQASN